jgi:hypothetical protein
VPSGCLEGAQPIQRRQTSRGHEPIYPNYFLG